MSTPQTDPKLAQQALDAVAECKTKSEAARVLRITRGCLDSRLAAAERYNLKAVIKSPFPSVAELNKAFTPASDKLRDEVIELRAQLKAVKDNTIDAEYVKRKIIGLTKNVSDVPKLEWLLKPIKGDALPGVPVALWSDWHWGETVYPDQVNGVNSYDLPIAHARARKLVEKTVYLLKHHVVNPQYPGIIINLGGDMMSGDIHEELSNTNEIPVLPALLDLFGVLCWALDTMAREFGKVFVPCVTGNHGRNTRKPQAKNRNFTNFDWLLYQFLAKHFAGDDRITFYIPDGPDALYSAYGHKYLLTHGDQFRGGDGIIGAIGPITRGNQRKLARNSSINREYDTMLLGHWHQYMPLHRTLVNGSLKGYDEYANVSNFGFEPPIQALWLTHPKNGVIMHLPIYLEAHPGRGEGGPWVSWQDKT